MLARATQLTQVARSRRISPLAIASYYAEAGEVDATFEWLERAFEERTPQLLHIAIDAYFEPMIREDPRFNDLLRRIGVPGAG